MKNFKSYIIVIAAFLLAALMSCGGDKQQEQQEQQSSTTAAKQEEHKSEPILANAIACVIDNKLYSLREMPDTSYVMSVSSSGKAGFDTTVTYTQKNGVFGQITMVVKEMDAFGNVLGSNTTYPFDINAKDEYKKYTRMIIDKTLEELLVLPSKPDMVKMTEDTIEGEGEGKGAHVMGLDKKLSVHCGTTDGNVTDTTAYIGLDNNGDINYYELNVGKDGIYKSIYIDDNYFTLRYSPNSPNFLIRDYPKLPLGKTFKERAVAFFRIDVAEFYRRVVKE